MSTAAARSSRCRPTSPCGRRTAAPFAGIISRPDPVLATGPVEVATLRPACAVNRFVSKGTDLVDGRPWELAQPLVEPFVTVLATRAPDQRVARRFEARRSTTTSRQR